MDEILPSLRTLLIDHLATSQALIADMAPGSKFVKIANTSRFRAGDEVFLMATPLNRAEKARIFAVPDFETLELEEATVPGWATADSSLVQKAINYAPLKRVYIGNLGRNPDFPSITITPENESNEWWALGATDHDFRVSIRVYVQTGNFEKSEILLAKYAKAIREILIDHIHPVINSQTEIFSLTVDLPANGTVATIPDTSTFRLGDRIILRDATPPPSSEENTVRTVLSPTELELNVAVGRTFETARSAELLRLNRYLYDTRPSDISYGYVPGASLLRAAQIDWFGKEVRCRPGNIAT